MTTAAVDSNISNLPAADQARTGIVTEGTTTKVSVTGGALSALVVETTTLAPNLLLDGKFTSCSFVGGAQIPEKFATAKGSKIKKSLFDLGSDSFKDVVDLKGDVKKLKIRDFKEGDKVKHKGETYTSKDISGKGFEGLSQKIIKLV